MTEIQLRKQIVEIMQSWLGRKEADGSHKAIIDLYNGHRPLARGYLVKPTDEWCATTVSAAFIKAGLTDIAPTECSCSKMIELYKKLGRWQESDLHIPMIGDIIMYDWEDSGIGDNYGNPNHVGIVAAVNGKDLTIIEGNKGAEVAYRAMSVNGKYIRGYCLPDYASKAKEEEIMTEEQFYEMFLKAMEAYNAERSKKPTSEAHNAAWSKAKRKGVLDGTRPKDPLTREQAATVLSRLGLL